MDRAKQGIDSFKQMKSGDILGGIASTTNTVTGVVSGLASNQGTKLPTSAANADNTVGKDNLKAAQATNNFYADAGVNFGYTKSSSKTNSHNESAVVTTIKGKDENSSITYNNVKNIEYIGTQAQDTKFIYNNVDNITKRAVELKNSYSSSSTSSGISTGVTIGYGDGTQTSVDAVKVSASQSKMNSNGTTYQNGRFVNVDEVHNNTKNMTLSGFNQEGGTVTGNIENLTIESKQNTSTTKGRTVGGSLSIAPNGMPSGSANYSQTNGERRVVDNASTFIIGDGSNLKVGKVENTASAIGTSGNGKLSIDEYVGHDLENVDKLKTVGGSVGISASGITSLGVNYSDKKQEGITKNTVIGNVEIGKSSGDEINRDLDSMTEITKDRDFKTNVNIESQTINYIKNPEKFKEDLQKAKNEIHDIYHAVDSTVNLQGKENRNILEQVGEVRQAKVIYNLIDSRLQKAENQEDIAKVFEGASEDLGYKVKVIYTDPSNSPQLIGVDKNGNKYIKDGTAYVDEKTGINYILVNTKSPANSTKAGVIGTIAEEQSHIIGKKEGRQKVVPDGSEKGLESLGKPTNDYFKKQYSKNDKAIDLKSDGKDYSNVDFGENVGDKKIKDPRDFLKNEYGTEKEKKELEDLFSKEKGEKVYIDWDLYEGNFSEAMHYSLYERLKNQISKYSYRYKINYWGFEAKTRVNDTNEINKDFKEIDNSEAVYHNYIPEINSINMEKNKINTKRVNYYTGQESVTDFNGKLVTDTWNIGTGNTFTYDPNKKNWANTRDKIYHGLVDIPNWVFLGTGIADKSTTWQRLRLFIMGAKVSGNYEELTDKGYNTVGEKELKDFYNRKQAEIEERKIKNTNLR